ncbi:ComF family protein [Labrenzia suaedae]|uniref:ComF family protein n=2 Tax=Roseibium litorale TaxID=2803841 RepID=A0ABR9CM90_9HYPH|nr:ComF family protein [Roseibium litorale]MBD8891980.1 ComF family protein [Roseibium litorale]
MSGSRSLKAGRICASAVLDLLLPPRCLACGCRTGHTGGLCPSCWMDMPFLENPVCERYGTPLPHDMGEGALSARAIMDPPVFDRSRSVARYEGPARQMVLALKFARHRDLGKPMGEWMARAGQELLSPESLVLPVPLHRWRLLCRRFNQSADLAAAVARAAGCTHEPMLLARTRRTRQQVGLDAASRQKNVRGAFAIRAGYVTDVFGRAVVLVDDVMTTGSTASACARVLKKAGASRVDVLTFALAVPEEA